MLPEDLVLIQHLERTARSVAVSSGFDSRGFWPSTTSTI